MPQPALNRSPNQSAVSASMSPLDRPGSTTSNPSSTKPPTPAPSTTQAAPSTSKGNNGNAAAGSSINRAPSASSDSKSDKYPAWSPYPWEVRIQRERQYYLKQKDGASADANDAQFRVSRTPSSNDAGAKETTSGDPANRTPSASHHHHHHHHHVHTHSAQTPGSAGSTPAAGASAASTPSAVGTAGSSSATAAGAPGARRPENTTPNPAGLGTRWGSAYPFFNPNREAERQIQREREIRAARERERERERDRERELDRQRVERERLRDQAAESERRRKETQTSPNVGPTSGPNPYPRPSLPPSPTVSRSLPAPNPTQSGQSSISPVATPGVTSSSTARTSITLPGFSSLGKRALPSPFERENRDRSSSTAGASDQAGQVKHNRTLSNSSTTETKPPQPGVISPRKSGGSETGSAWKGYPGDQRRSDQLSQPQPQQQQQQGAAPPQQPERSPLASPTISNKPPVTASSTMNTAGSNAQGQSRHFSAYGYSAPFGFGGNSYGGAYGNSWLERERQRQRDRDQREREQERIRERERLEKLEKDRAEREKQQRLANPPPPTESRQFGLYNPGGLYRMPYERVGQSSSTNQSRIEVLNAPNADPQAAARPGEPGSNQIPTSRESRPYSYAGKNEPGIPAANAASVKDREYHYTPRDKRSRMDAAIEEQAHRRGSSNKTKRRKEDERARSPPSAYQAPAPTRPLPHLANLTREIKEYPEVTSAQIESWLKTIPDLTAVRSRHIYGGADWRLAGDLPGDATLGDLMVIQINAAFLGPSWVLRGEDGWDTADPETPEDLELSEGLNQRQIFGTDVYTDDSDLGLILIHAGWLKWKHEAAMEVEKTESKAKPSDQDSILVSVRLAPRLVRYVSTLRNGIASRGWGNGHDGLSIVVEGVQRYKASRKAPNSRANRKLRMAEMAIQRASVMRVAEPLKEAPRYLNGVLPSVVFVRDAPLIKYNISDLRDYLEIPDADEMDARSLWTHDLHMESEDDVYTVSLEDDARASVAPKIRIEHSDRPGRFVKSNGSVSAKKATLAESRSPDDLSWTKDGLLVRLDGEAGVLCAVEAYTWKRRAGVSLLESMDTTE
ncbi:hypothetical protein BD324DRAFT_638273 [Kockovaella imperatae]|uniref:Histone deacetylation protein Rxt3-domain-containing protein n=1 Tax=Kockovaella imperatae TaxID=4999 RepID=A0A1Y1U957_9TREE|nr:hypothetical protein BD324DRAFT_638273 [Kockovaella imperatae]ORX34074.1 hypothetical protein BD324DRAFT_638273 [Kockovaella imperatae]